MIQEDVFRGERVERSVLPGGLIVLTERIPGLRSLSLGFWVRRGSRHEERARSGGFHFLEHMLFKGTETRDTAAIARIIDSIGGQVNAFTGKENTCFYARILDEHLDPALDLLADLFLAPAFRPDDLERERKVILEEIKMVEDTPDDLVQNLLLESLWRGNPLARPILGTRATVRALDAPTLAGFFHDHVRPDTVLVAASGNVEHASLLDRLARVLDRFTGTARPVPVRPPDVHSAVEIRRRRGLKQCYVCLGTRAYPRNHPGRYALSVLNTLLGTGMSSRLFQTVREERSLAYDVYSEAIGYADAGCLMVYAGTAAESLRELIDVVLAELAGLKRTTVGGDELGRAKAHLKGNLMLGLESTFNRMTNLATQELYFGRQETLDEILAAIDGVTADDVQATAAEVLDGASLSLAVLGKLPEGFDIDRAALRL